jgi:hypothetical protein
MQDDDNDYREGTTAAGCAVICVVLTIALAMLYVMGLGLMH